MGGIESKCFGGDSDEGEEIGSRVREEATTAQAQLKICEQRFHDEFVGMLKRGIRIVGPEICLMTLNEDHDTIVWGRHSLRLDQVAAIKPREDKRSLGLVCWDEACVELQLINQEVRDLCVDGFALLIESNLALSPTASDHDKALSPTCSMRTYASSDYDDVEGDDEDFSTSTSSPAIYSVEESTQDISSSSSDSRFITPSKNVSSSPSRD